MSTAASGSLEAQLSSTFTVTVRGLWGDRPPHQSGRECRVQGMGCGGLVLDLDLRGRGKTWGRVGSDCALNLVGRGSVGWTRKCAGPRDRWG